MNVSRITITKIANSFLIENTIKDKRGNSDGIEYNSYSYEKNAVKDWNEVVDYIKDAEIEVID